MLQQRFDKLSQDANYRFTVATHHWPGLYINAGHGSKGLVTCPLAAELLASLMSGEPLPVSRSVADALNPARFIIRNLIRRKTS
jgi:tRNA 5-methylaminomethyl-2-thiouridine biosynthesis bifunctional protein